ncbi:hypothetical protein EDC96DRAFT_532334, partial [Choanephora cucurbitarum]
MVTAISDRAVALSENVIIHVVGVQSITLEAKGSDSGLKTNFMINNNIHPMLFYFLRFFKTNSTHRIIVSRQFASSFFVGTILGAVMPLEVIPIDGTVAPSERNTPGKNWDNKNYIASNNSIKQAFAEHLEDFYEDLVDEELIVNDCIPIVPNEKKEKMQTKIKSSKRKVVEKGINPKVVRTDPLSESLNNFVELIDDDISFPSDLFVPSGSMNI